MDHTKIKLRVGNNEFEAEGPPELVRELYNEFKQLNSVDHDAAPPRTEPSQDWLNTVLQEPATKLRSMLDSPTVPVLAPAPIEYWPSMKIFSINRTENRITLSKYPPSPNRRAKSILLILWAYLTFYGLEYVPVTELSTACRESKLSMPRIDRHINSYRGLNQVTSQGVGKGTKYGLTGVGQIDAETVLVDMIFGRGEASGPAGGD